MRYSKYFLAAAAISAAIGIAGPAAADVIAYPLSVTNVSISGTPGEGVALSTETVGYAGIIKMDINFTSNPANAFPVVTFCDDLNHYIYVGAGPYPYYSAVSAAAGVNTYLNPALSLGSNNITKIEGLSFLGTDLYDTSALSAQKAAEIQVAIWELEYANLTATDTGFQTDVTNLINGAMADYAKYTSPTLFSTPWVDEQLVSPCDPVSDPQPGHPTAVNVAGVDYNSCQSQGQLVAVPGIPTSSLKLPEPGTLALLGMGLLGFGAFRRRRTKTA